MRDRELYAAILGLEKPWTVERVELDMKQQRVDVWIGREAGATMSCPQCATECRIYDHREREWRHLDTCQFTTQLHARVPRVECPTHGVVQVAVPWAARGSQFTALFERLVIDWLREAPVAAVARRLHLTWDEAWGIMQRAVARGLARRPPLAPIFVGVDEKAFRRGHEYVTVVADVIEGAVLYVGDGRTRESLEPFWTDTLTPEARREVAAIAMDMWEPYVQATVAHVPGATDKIVFDKFHIAKHLNEAVDQVRRGEHRELRRRGDDRLSRTKYWWLMNPTHLAGEARRAFAALRRGDLKVARAWALKETVLRLWDYRSVAWARSFFRRWYFWATHSRLAPMIKTARMLQRHLANILTYVTYPITNAMLESINATIQAVKAKARGFRNRENFKTAIYFHCGHLELYPH